MTAQYAIPSFMSKDEIKNIVTACGPRLIECKSTSDGWLAVVDGTQSEIDTLSRDLSYGPLG